MGALDNIRRFLSPDDYQEAAIESMEQSNKFSPGVPILPNDGFSRVPRAHDFLTGYNIAARPRRNERVSFSTLQGLIEAYDIAQMAITHRIDSVRSLDWYLEPIDGIDYDTSEMISHATRVLKKPDHQLPFRAWLSKFLWDVLAYDAGTLYRMRNNAGRCIGLSVVDGTTIAPLIDYHGNRPTGDAPAFVQFAQGVPWNWLTQDDLIYIPFRPLPNSPYGKSPLESILLNANTDLRFQNYFLSRFTEGTVPEGFANAPESWTPDQISDYQEAWDALMWGDETKKHQIRWVPGGTDFTWTREEKFDPEFSLFLMRKTAAAFHVTPNDLGFTDTVNLANGETQMDVQFRIGDLPIIQHVQDILSSFIQDDLGLPLEFKFNTGGAEEDRLAAAQAHKIYIDAGVVSSSVIAQEVYGITEPDGQAVPRYIMTAAGPIPLNALREAAGQVDAETGAPMEATPTIPMAPVTSEFKPAGPVEKDATAGITSGTGLTGSPMLEQGTASEPELDEQELEDEEDTDVAKSAELLAFRRFVKARRKSGKWRNFEFVYVTKEEGDSLNSDAAESLRPVGLLCVHAEDTGRILIEQRLHDPADPNSDKFDLPGGHLEEDESFKDAALREWGEEIGLPLPEGIWGGEWESKSGNHRGFVYHIAHETDLNLRDARFGSDPDAHGSGEADAILWVTLDNLKNNPMVKPDIEKELGRIRDAVEAHPLAKGRRESADETTDHGHVVAVTKETYSPNVGMKVAAKRALRWKEEGKAKGAGTPVGWGRATDIVAGRAMSEDVVKRMYSFFARHEVDKKGEGFTDTTNPSNGRIMWDAWGGDAGFSWSKAIVERLNNADVKKADDTSSIMKGWRESADKTPQHKYDIRLTDYYKPLISKALNAYAKSLRLEETIAVFKDSDVKGTRGPALKDLRAQIVPLLGKGDTTQLTEVMRNLYADSYLAGLHAGNEQLNERVIKKAVVDWSNWKPGDVQASATMTDGGLARLLEQAGITVDNLQGPSLDAVGNIIARGLADGSPGSVIAANIRAEYPDVRSEMIAHTESTRGIQAGTFESYTANGVGLWELLPSDGACEECLALVGQQYPATDLNDMPPIHPYCRCTTLPVVESIGADTGVGAGAGPDLLTMLADEALQNVVLPEVSEVLAENIPEVPKAFDFVDAMIDNGTRKEFVKDIYEGQDFAGFHVDITRAEYGNGKTQVVGVIKDKNDAEAGIVQRWFSLNKDGTPVVDHVYLALDPEFQGKGFATAFSKFSENWYRASGFQEIRVHAALDKGGYAWARAGYTWDPAYYVDGKIPESVIDKLRYNAESLLDISDETRQTLEGFANRLSGPIADWPSPFEISEMVDPGYEDLGHELLMYTDWYGIKPV